MNTLTTQLYHSLLRHAALLLAGHTAAHAMQPADLLHMAVERLCSRPPAHIRKHPAQFTGLMRTVMQRTLIDELRKLSVARRPDLFSAVPLEDAGEIPADATSFIRAAIHEALAMLESRDPAAAALIRLHFLEGRSGVELASRFGKSTAWVSRHLSAALIALRSIFEPD